uniref:BZIP domain-containing protein n=1 Tax=Strigamia maritima TaxID=126957 RepID=T1J8H7_STRMM
MDAMVDDHGNVVVSQASSAATQAQAMEVVSPSHSDNAHSPVTQVVTATGQTIAVPTGSGSVSIVHVLPSQQHVQSVIQPNQQSVIQTTPSSGTALQTVQLSKGNVILLNKNAAGSVIHSATGATQLQAVQKFLQVATLETSDDGTAEDENKKRREILARRPSYRKILNELSSADTPISADVKDDGTLSSETSSQEATDAANTITVAGVTVVPAGAIQIATGSQGEGIQGLQTLTMSNANAGTTGTIVQYAQGQDGQFFVPVTVSAADLQAYQIRSGTTTTNLSQGVVMASSGNIQTPQQLAEEAARKRELRLLKNREAARECRRKKKEYIKCLENRVAVLENQNKALIEELKSLKELYCQKNE